MTAFTMNGYFWEVVFVDPSSPLLVDRTGTLTLATTDPYTHKVCVSDALRGSMLLRVLLHEMGHCAMFSFGLIDDLHRMVYPEYREEAEEWVCNFIADYGLSIFSSAYRILGVKAIDVIPDEIERLIA